MKITFYRTAGGASPVEKYLVDLDSKERAAVADALKAIETSGLRAAGVRMRQIKGKLWEIKASQPRRVHRRAAREGSRVPGGVRSAAARTQDEGAS